MSAGSRTIAGYRDKLSVVAGETVNFMVSSFDEGAYQADLVRIISGNNQAEYAGLELEEIPADFAAEYAGSAQRTRSGSFASCEFTGWQPGQSFSFACAVMPTTTGRGDMTLIALRDERRTNELMVGFRESGELYAEYRSRGDLVSSVELTAACPIKRWSFAGIVYDSETQTLQLFQKPIANGPGDTAALYQQIDSAHFALAGSAFAKLTFAARCLDGTTDGSTDSHFNGRMDSPRLAGTALSIESLETIVRSEQPGDVHEFLGFWDFSADMGGATFANRIAGGRQGRLHNLPARAVKGIRWNGSVRDWPSAPAQYSAVHFHEDDVYDAGWAVSFSYTVPEGLRSGAYAARLRKADEVEYLLFFVCPRVPEKTVAFLASTSTYLAYANEKVGLTVDGILDGKFDPLPEEQLLLDHPEFGLSLYDHHLDGSGVHFSSFLRPTLNWRPDTRVWAFNADTDILRWLERQYPDYEVITDQLLHERGTDLLESYQVVITGSHPEYYSTEMLDSIESFLNQGGRLMYLGGNGFYWRVAQSPAWPAALELRRAEDGTRAWMSQAGEYHHQFDGQSGGLWRRQNRTPQKLVGVGFTAQGSHKGLRFRRSSASTDPRVKFAFTGIDQDILADFRKMAATPNAEELDRVDFELGSPAHTLVLASTENPAPDMMRTKEELLIALPQIPDPDIRGDVVFFETLSGGAVFSTGSIGWSSILAFDDYENPAARLTCNMLRRFCDPTPFEAPRRLMDHQVMTPQIYQAPPGMRAGRLPAWALLKQAVSMALMTVGLSLMVRFRGLPLLKPKPRR